MPSQPNPAARLSMGSVANVAGIVLALASPLGGAGDAASLPLSQPIAQAATDMNSPAPPDALRAPLPPPPAPTSGPSIPGSGLSIPAGQPRRIGPAKPLLGVWLTLNDMGTLRDRPKLEEAVNQLGRLGFTTLYPVVWNGGYAYYASAVSQQRKLQDFTVRGLQGQDPLAELISLARSKGMQVVPWFEFGFMAPPSSELAKRYPQWLTQTREGATTSLSAAGEVVWLNPFRPEVQQLLTDLALEVVTLYDVDGIQLDDHFSLPNSFGYDSFTRALYLRETGRSVPANAQDPAWIRWRAEKITAFLRRLRSALKARKSSLLISLSPNYADFAYKLQLQDWRTWVKAGLVDEVVVQLYRPDVASFTAELRRPEFQDKTLPMAVALMAGQRLRPTALPVLQGQMEASRQRDLGVAFFHYGPLWEATADPAGRLRELEGVLGGDVWR